MTDTYARRPWVWRVCLALDCRRPFPTQVHNCVYCSAHCCQTAAHYRRVGLLAPALRPADRVCANPRCGALFVPVPFTRRYCSMACSRRTRWRRFDQRRRTQEVAS